MNDMKKITKIELQKRDKDRVNIELDGEFAFAIYVDVLFQAGLKVGMEVDEVTLQTIEYEEQKKKALNQAFKYLSFSDRSEGELMDYLLKKEYSQNVVEHVLDRLKKVQYIQDERVAKQIVQGKQRVGKSKKYIIEKLKQKKIGKNESIEAIEAHYNKIQEEMNIKNLVEKYFNILVPKYSAEEIKHKIAQKLYGQGYEWQSFYPIIEMMIRQKSGLIEEYAEDVSREKKNQLYKEAEKLNRKYSLLPQREQMIKIKQALNRKGYPRDWIEEILEALQE